MKNTLYIFLIILVTSVFNSCQKSNDVTEPDSVFKDQSAVPEVNLDFPENICADEEFAATLSVKNCRAGNLQILISDDEGKSWIKIAETGRSKITDNFYITLRSGSYKIKGIYSGVNNGRNLVIQSEIFSIDVPECIDCESLVLEPNLTESNYLVDAGELKTFTAEYTVLACDQDYFDLTLKGKLIRKAQFRSSIPRDIKSERSGENLMLSWYIGNAVKGFSQKYIITFEYKIPEAPYGSLVPLTGGWVLEGKRRDGSNVRIGDNNEIFVQIQ